MAMTDLNPQLLDKFYPTSMKLGDYKVELRGYKDVAGHDDSMPYQAKVLINGKECAVAYNDGWGGETNVQATKEEGFKILHALRAYLREHGKEFSAGSYQGIELHYDTLEFVCDELATNLAYRKDAGKLATKKMVLYNPKTKTMSSLSFKGTNNTPIRQLGSVPAFRKVWENAVSKYESQGYVVLSITPSFPEDKVAV